MAYQCRLIHISIFISIGSAHGSKICKVLKTILGRRPKSNQISQYQDKTFPKCRRNLQIFSIMNNVHKQIKEICKTACLVAEETLKTTYCQLPTAFTRLTTLFLGLPGWAGTRKAKPIWILLKQETVSGSGISWAICKSAPHSRQTTMPAPHHSVFHRPDALPATNQQRQSTEGKRLLQNSLQIIIH